MHVGCWLSGRTGGLFVACPGFCPASFLDTSVRLGCPFVRHFFFFWHSLISDFLFVHTLPCWGDWLFICSHALIIHCIVAFIYHSIAFYYLQDIILDLAVGENFFHLDRSCAHISGVPIIPSNCHHVPSSCYHVDIQAPCSCKSPQLERLDSGNILEN